jgi:hypothetical protein
MISTCSAVKQAKQQVSCDLAGEAAILSLRNGVYYGLNPIGARIWNLIQEPKSVGELRDAIVAEYEVQPEACERDLLALLADLEKNELIEVTQAS